MTPIHVTPGEANRLKRNLNKEKGKRKTMNIKEFVELVARMRAADKLYFRKRTKTHLEAAIDLERQVDQAIAQGVEVEGEGIARVTAGQLGMFGRD
jgi:hypothetical protein